MALHSHAPNHFLASLSAEDHALLRPHLKPMDLVQGEILYEPGGRVDRVYFPHGGVVSFVVGLRNGQFVEAGLLGKNGVIGAGAALDGRHALNRAIVQVSGPAARIDTAILKKFSMQSESLHLAMMTVEQALFAHTQQVAACNAVHDLEARLSRWLLQVRDLVGGETLLITQEFLAQMLGVQRTSVTLVARHLQQAGLITTQRGRVDIIDPEGLRDAACECYEAINEQFARLIGWRPKPE